MRDDTENALRTELRDPDYSEGYAESFLNSYIATQIKVIREQRKLTQAQLSREIGTTQAGISRIEDVNYSSWSVKTLIKLARAFHVRLKVSFEPFGTLPSEVVRFDRDSLERVPREEDPNLEDGSDTLAFYMSRGENLIVPAGAERERDPVDIGTWKAMNPDVLNYSPSQLETGGALSYETCRSR